MAVAKASYSKGGSRGLVRYALHREAEREQEQRYAFTAGTGRLDAQGATAELKQHERGQGYTYHLILNPGEGHDPHHRLLEEWTRRTMLDLELKHRQPIPYVAVIHKDHSDHAHVHVIAHTERTLNRAELNYTREVATHHYEDQKRQYEAQAQRLGVRLDRQHGGEVQRSQPQLDLENPAVKAFAARFQPQLSEPVPTKKEQEVEKVPQQQTESSPKRQRQIEYGDW